MEQTETFHSEVAACLVVNPAGEVVVVNQGFLSWSLPKGHIDEGETALQAAVREAYEEAGLENMTFVRPLGSYDRYRTALTGGDDTREHKTIHVFLFTSDQKKLESHDLTNPIARWVPKHEVAALLTHRRDKEFFNSIVGEL